MAQQSMTVPLSGVETRYACCDKARRSLERCSCLLIVTCPVHGTNHVGNH